MISIKYLLLVGCLLVFFELQLLHAAPGTDDPEPPKPTSTVTLDKLTTEDYATLTKTGRLSVVQQGNGIFIPGPIKIPCGQTWASWWAANYWYFQCQANMNCRPYIGCWCNACACYTFIVNPQYPPCRRWIPWPIDISSIRVDGYLSLETKDGK